MALKSSTMLPLGSAAPSFQLPDAAGDTVSLDQFRSAPALLVAFICNHCPFVQHVREGLAQLGNDLQAKGAAMVAINANDVSTHPADSPANMAKEIKRFGYPFPYLYDETQEVAKAYRAACTPDFYLFDGDQKLVYRGQMDDSRPDNGLPVTGTDILTALEAILAGQPVAPEQKQSIGCNIKWRPGNEPEYYG